jgi:hypothetical protein
VEKMVAFALALTCGINKPFMVIPSAFLKHYGMREFENTLEINQKEVTSNDMIKQCFKWLAHITEELYHRYSIVKFQLKITQVLILSLLMNCKLDNALLNKVVYIFEQFADGDKLPDSKNFPNKNG